MVMTFRPALFARVTRPSAAQVDLALGLVFLLVSAGLWMAGELAARRAIATYGHNVDSGAFEQAVALFIALPVAIVLLLAATGHGDGRGWGPVLHAIGTKLAILAALIVGCFVYLRCTA